MVSLPLPQDSYIPNARADDSSARRICPSRPSIYPSYPIRWYRYHRPPDIGVYAFPQHMMACAPRYHDRPTAWPNRTRRDCGRRVTKRSELSSVAPVRTYRLQDCQVEAQICSYMETDEVGTAGFKGCRSARGRKWRRIQHQEIEEPAVTCKLDQ